MCVCEIRDRFANEAALYNAQESVLSELLNEKEISI